MRVRLVVLSCSALLLSIGAACGFDAVGSLDVSPSGQDPGDASDAARVVVSDDGDVPTDANVEAASLPEVPIGPEMPIGDAGAPVGDCGSPVIADLFNGGIGPGWRTTGEAKAATESSGNGFVRMIPRDQGGKVAGLFIRPTFLATSFNASFRYYASKPFTYGTVGDGFTFFWITSGAVSDATLADQISGGGLGIPRTLGGYAFAFDAYRNGGYGDPSPPSFSLLHVEPAKGQPASYDWHVTNKGPYNDAVYDSWLNVVVTFNGGKLSATVNGTAIFTNAAVPAANILALGFTASTGGTEAIGFGVDTVSFELTDPVCQ